MQLIAYVHVHFHNSVTILHVLAKLESKFITATMLISTGKVYFSLVRRTFQATLHLHLHIIKKTKCTNTLLSRQVYYNSSALIKVGKWTIFSQLSLSKLSRQNYYLCYVMFALLKRFACCFCGLEVHNYSGLNS